MQTYTFKKTERLCSSILIKNLFNKGNSVVTLFPFRIIWQRVTEPNWTFPAQVLITVSKRSFKRGVDRNRIKRQIRELYRLNKQQLYNVLSQQNQKIAISINYIGKSKLKSAELEPAFTKLMLKWVQQLQGLNKV